MNQAKKRGLAEKHGAHFSEMSDLPPEIVEQWLNNIEQFERQFEQAREISIREFLGNPAFPILEELSPERLKEEISFRTMNSRFISGDMQG